jgi:glycerophosphoryl diester phosphodiesterase
MKKIAMSRPLIIAHRGYMAKYPENTLAAFEAAIHAGAHMIELDVTFTKDRKVVVIHDDTLERTTSGKGSVSDFTLEEIRRLDAGTWFHPRFAGEKVPLLEEVLDLAADRVMVNVEIKASAWDDTAPPDAMENQVLETILRKKLLETVLISSFDHKFLDAIASFEKRPDIAVLTHDPGDPKILERCMRLKAFSIHPNFRKVDGNLVKTMKSNGLQVFPFSVNTTRKIRQLLHMGVDGIITADPCLMK